MQKAKGSSNDSDILEAIFKITQYIFTNLNTYFNSFEVVSFILVVGLFTED
jgi:hypothetical protein